MGCLFSCNSRHALVRHKCKASKKRKFIDSQPVGPIHATNIPDVPHDTENQPSYLTPIVIPKNSEIDERKVCDGGDGDEKLSVIEEFCKIVSDCSDYNTLKVLKNVIELIHSEFFDIDLFRTRVKNLDCCIKHCKDTFSRKAAKDGFHKKTVFYEDNNTKYAAEYFCSDIVTVLRDQVVHAREEDIIYNPPEVDNVRTSKGHPMQLSYFRNAVHKRKMEIMRSTDPESMWYNSQVKKSFVGFMQMFTDKTVTTMKIGGIAAHVVHATFLNFTKKYRKTLIQEGKTIIGFLPTGSNDVNADSLKNSEASKDDESEFVNITDLDEVVGDVQDDDVLKKDSKTIALMDKVMLTSTAAGRRVKMGILHKSMMEILQPLLDVSVTGFKIQRQHCTFICYPMFMSYCCDIPEAKDMSAVRHNLNTRCPCHRCLVTLSDITNLSTGKQRLHTGTNWIRTKINNWIKRQDEEGVQKGTGEELSALEFSENLLKQESLSALPSFIEVIIQRYPSFLPPSLYEIFTYEPLHNLHLGISKLLKTLTFELVGSEKIVSFRSAKKSSKAKFSSKRTAILRACNSLLRAIEKDCTTTSMHIDFSTKETSSALNGFFLESGIRGMLEGKDYRNLDYVFPFVAAFIDRVTGCEEGGITTVHTVYSYLLFRLFTEVEQHGISHIEALKIRASIKRLKKECKRVFDPYVQKGLYTLKFHLLDHLVEDLLKYGSLDYLNAGPYEYYNTVVKKHYRATSKRRSTALEETANRMSEENSVASVEHMKSSAVTGNSAKANSSQYLVRDGMERSLRQLKGLQGMDGANNCSALCREIVSALPPTEIPVLTRLIEDHLKHRNITVMDFGVHVTLVKSGYIEALQTPSLSSFDSDKCKVIFNSDGVSSKSRKRVFATYSFGPSKKQMNSTVFMRGDGDGDRDEFWFAKVILLMRITCEKSSYEDEVAMVRYFTCTQPTDEIDNILDCICLRWETEDGIDHSKKNVGHESMIEAGEEYGLIPFQSICGTCELIRSNYAIHPFTTEIPWTHHKFYVNRFLP